MPEKDIELLVWDLETTGLVAPESKVLEIGALIVTKDGIERKNWVLQNNVDIPAKIIEITGITPGIVDAEGRDPKECLNEFLPLFKRAKKHVTHNGYKFDIPFLTAYASDLMGYTPAQLKAMMLFLQGFGYDTAVEAKAKKLNMKQRDGESFSSFADRVMSVRAFGVKFNLGLCCDELKIDRSKITQHRALGDVELTHALYMATVGAPRLFD